MQCHICTYAQIIHTHALFPVCHLIYPECEMNELGKHAQKAYVQNGKKWPFADK